MNQNNSNDAALSILFKALGRYELNEVIAHALKFFLGNAYESLIITDKNMRVQFMDRESEVFHGLEPGEAKGRHVREFVPNSLQPTVMETAKPMIGKIWEVKGVQKVGSVYPLMKGGKVIGAFGKTQFSSLEFIGRINDEMEKLKKEVYYLKQREKSEYSSLYTFANILGDSRLLREAVELAKKIASLDADVLIVGESGTGKELFAQSIHSFVDSNKPFVRVNCPAIPFELAESHLFGYEKGAFTGAVSVGKPGVFEAAEGGTVFLDEISSLPLSIQAKLLRVLQEREVMRVGSTKTKKIKFKSIAATNIDLQQLVKEGKFRHDLYYRVAKAKLEIPSLRERSEDIPLYLRTFLKTINQSFSTNIPGFSSEALDILCRYNWPGNVRELINMLEQIAIRVWNDNEIGVKELPEEVRLHPNPKGLKKFQGKTAQGLGIRQRVTTVEREMIISALTEAEGNKRKAAGLLRMPRSTFYKKLTEYRITYDPSSSS